MTCNYLYLGIVEYVDDVSDLTKVSYKGLVYSFLLSVGNDTRWVNTLESAAKSCISQFDGANEGYDCESSCFFFLLENLLNFLFQ